jgi:glycosyltransferase involved in cell wall biosynthesis
MADRPLTVMSLVTEEGRGGSDRLALEVSRGLKSRGHRVIWGSPSDCALNEEARDAGLEMFSLAPWESGHLIDLSSLIHFCRDERVAIVNTHHSRGRHMLLRARLAGLRTKVVFTRHCILKTLPYLGSFFHNFLVDMNIAVSNVVRESLVHGGVWSHKAVTIYGGINAGRFENCPAADIEAVRRKYARKDAFIIGMVARLQHTRIFDPGGPTLKGHDVLFRSLSRLPNDIILLLIGPDTKEDREKLAAIARHHGVGEDRLTFCGFQENIVPFYKIMDLHVLPSPNEGLGLAVIEAMAAGVPCIGVDSGGVREIIDNGTAGFLFRPGDSDDLASRIRILREDAEKRKLFVLKGREKVREKFGIEKTVGQTEKIMYGLLR